MKAPSSPLTLSELQLMAPTHLESYLQGRYQGDHEHISLAIFAPEDQKLLGQIYVALLKLLHALKPCHENGTDCNEVLKAFVQTPDYTNLTFQMSHLGHATEFQMSKEEVARLVHDLRGGAFQALAFRLQLFAFAPGKAQGLQNIYFLVRDHLKIMRNCVHDLDPGLFEADSRSLSHDTTLLVEKWSHADFRTEGKEVVVELDCRYEGTLCESCLEFSSLDRIIYNLMNNAARYTADGLIYFHALPVPDVDSENVRFVVVNRVSDEHRQILLERFGDDLGGIFQGGFTTGGHGVGMRLCADFCAHAYGISDFTKAKESEYFGACWAGDYFVTWFHWPVAAQ